MELFHHLHQKEGRTIVLVTHDQELAHQADRIIIINDGKVSFKNV
jgi:putative ABC transport system ATP-binding protein